MQNLMTMNLVDVILHTRVPPGRLVDWIDQAFLLIHLDRADRADARRLRDGEEDASSCPGQRPASSAQVGIRTATDLLKALSTERSTGDDRCPRAPLRRYPTRSRLSYRCPRRSCGCSSGRPVRRASARCRCGIGSATECASTPSCRRLRSREAFVRGAGRPRPPARAA